MLRTLENGVLGQRRREKPYSTVAGAIEKKTDKGRRQKKIYHVRAATRQVDHRLAAGKDAI